MNNVNIKKFFFSSTILFLVLSSFYYGYKYSVFNTDLHHYSVVLEVIFDKINGYKINKDIFVIYGNGQIYLFEFFSKFIDINLANIGIVTQLFFSLKFILFFYILRFFVDDTFSILGTIIYYSLHTFTQVVSGDIYANFFLHLFVIFYVYNSKKKNFFILTFTSFLLFLVFFFRHTYILNFIILIPIVLFLYIFMRKNLIYEIKIFSFFSLISILFFILLHQKGIFFPWLDQFLGMGINVFLDLEPKPDTGLFLTFKKLLFYLARILRHVLIPNSNGSSYFFSIIFIFNVYFISSYIFYFYKFKKIEIKSKDKLLIILSLLAFSGSIQVINQFEISRYLNSSFAFIIIFITIIYRKFNKIDSFYKKFFLGIFSLVLFLPVLSKYPFYSNFYNFKLDHVSKKTEFMFTNEYFNSYEQKIFKKKRISEEFIIFYKDVKNFVCKYDKIYNLSFDRSLHYLCDIQKDYIPSLFFKVTNNQFSIKNIKNDKTKNLVIISDQILEDFSLINTIKIPKYYRFTKSDIFFNFFPEHIYFYELE